MKKLISILVVVAMLAAFLVPSAFATEEPQIVVSGAEAAPGDEIRLIVSLKNNPGITNGKVEVTYDESALELVAFDFENECTWRGLIDGNVENGEVAFATTADTTKDHVMFEVVLKVKDGASGDYKVGLIVHLMKNNAEEDIAFQIVEGVVSVNYECPHTNVAHIEAVEPGCHMEGNIEYWYCTECQMVWQDEARTQLTNHKNVILPATGGEVVHVEAKAANCYENGNIEYWYCEECEQVWQDEALTQLTNHKNVIVPAYHESLAHVEAVEPGCHMEGNIEYWYCVECELVWQDEALTQLTNHKNVILPATGGNLIHVEAVEPGCHYAGNIEYWYCTECEVVWQDEALTQITNHMNVILPAIGGEVIHVEAKAPTCSAEGNIEHWYCEECEQVWQDEALTQLTNHKNVILPMVDHDIVHVEAVDAGCHMNGNIEYWYCAECEMVWQDEALTQITNFKNVILPATGGEVVHVEAVAPGCHMNGNIEYWYCEECEQVWQDAALTQLTNHKNVILPAIGGNVVHIEAVEPGCHMNGNIEYWYCTECDLVWQDAALTQITNHMNVILPATGGDVVHVEAKAPTCSAEGNIEYWYCEECELVWQDEALTQITNHKNVILPMADHDIVHMDAVAPGCHYEGNIEYWYCAECEMVWQDEALTQITNRKNVILPAIGGDVVHVEAVEPGCHFEGNIEYWYCEECEQVWQDKALTQLTNRMNVILPATGGEVVHVEAKAPTCTENGNIEHWYCDECEQVWQDEARTQLTNHKNVIIAATEHDFVDGICSVCGEADPNAPATGDSIFVAIAAALISGLGIVALTTKKREF